MKAFDEGWHSAESIGASWGMFPDPLADIHYAVKAYLVRKQAMRQAKPNVYNEAV